MPLCANATTLNVIDSVSILIGQAYHLARRRNASTIFAVSFGFRVERVC